ncbi:MAG: hypothetical protein U1C50_03935 [Patescibacteria group bacterium]|nr:hypothetical protein [Patescibacteria group bacterium]
MNYNMRLPPALETIALILAVLFPFYWYNQTSLSKFSLQLVALLILAFTFHSWIARRSQKVNPIQMYQKTTNIVIVTIISLLLILTTGGASSMLFWLLDFLLFFVAIFSHPRAGFTLALAIGIAFLLNEPLLTNQQLTNLVSLLLMAPLATIFSTQYSRLIMAKKEIKALSNQAKKLNQQVQAEEQSTLIWLSLDFRRQLEQAIDLVSQISSNLSQIPYHQRDNLDKLYHDLKALWHSGQELERKIDRITEE